MFSWREDIGVAGSVIMNHKMAPIVRPRLATMPSTSGRENFIFHVDSPAAPFPALSCGFRELVEVSISVIFTEGIELIGLKAL